MADTSDILGGDSASIKVCVRVRPFIREEIEGDRSGGKIELCIGMPTTTMVQMIGKDEPRNFEFDRCYWSHSKDHHLYADQQTLQDELGESMIKSAMNGFNNCIFAYGQTGSGKSFSVLGGKGDARGLLPRVVEALFEKFDKLDESVQMKTEVSFIEIYGDLLRDLFAVKEEGKELPKLDVKQHPVLGTIIPGLTEAPVSSCEQVMDLVEYGTLQRTVAETAMNSASSRSHCVFTFKTSVSENNGPVRTSGTNLVDLAGSERAGRTKATGQRLKEGAAINQSLSALANVIRELAKQASGPKKKANPPFRSSKLTWILKEPLSGNSKTVMMAAISPSSVDYDETLSTMQFAKSVKQIQTKAVVNSVNEKGIEEALRAELAELHMKLKEYQEMAANGQLGAPPGEGGGASSGDGGGGGGGGGGGMRYMPAHLERRIKEQEQLCKWYGKTWNDVIEEERQRQQKRAAILHHDSAIINFRTEIQPLLDQYNENGEKNEDARSDITATPADGDAEQESESEESVTDTERRLNAPLVHLFKPGEDEEGGRSSLRLGTPSSIAIVGPRAASCKKAETEVNLHSTQLKRLRYHAVKAEEIVGLLSKEGLPKLQLRVVVAIEPGESGEQTEVEILVHAYHVMPEGGWPVPAISSAPEEPAAAEGVAEAAAGDGATAADGAEGTATAAAEGAEVAAEAEAPAGEDTQAGEPPAGAEGEPPADTAQPEKAQAGEEDAPPAGEQTAEAEAASPPEPERPYCRIEKGEWITEETLMKRLKWLKTALLEDNFDQADPDFGGDAWLAAIDGRPPKPPPPPPPEPEPVPEEEKTAEAAEGEEPAPEPEPEPEKEEEPPPEEPWMALQRSQAREISRLNGELLTAHDEVSTVKGKLKKEKVVVQELRQELSSMQEELAVARAKLKMGVLDSAPGQPVPAGEAKADARLAARLDAAKEELARREKEAAKQSANHVQALTNVRMESANFAKVLTMTFDNAINAIDEAQAELDRLGLPQP